MGFVRPRPDDGPSVHGKVVYKKKPEATKKLGERIKALDVDVLATQEVENIEALDDFVETQGLRRAGYRHLVLVEENDHRLIDIGVIARLPIGAVISWRHRTYRTARASGRSSPATSFRSTSSRKTVGASC